MNQETQLKMNCNAGESLVEAKEETITNDIINTLLHSIDDFTKIDTITSHLMKKNQLKSSGDKRKLFVGNLPAKTTLQELFNAFKVYGPINEQLCVVKDENYAFIHFHEEKDAEKAYIAMNDSFFKNRYIRVQYSTSQGHVKKTKTETDIKTKLS